MQKRQTKREILDKVDWKKISPEETIKYLKMIMKDCGRTNSVKDVHDCR